MPPPGYLTDNRLEGRFALPITLREEISLSANLSSSAAPTQPSRWGPFGYVAFTVIWTDREHRV